MLHAILSKRFPRIKVRTILILILIVPSLGNAQNKLETSMGLPKFFAGKFEIAVPEFPMAARTRKISIDCNMPSSCMFQVDNETAVRYEFSSSNQLMEFTRGTLAYAKSNPTKVLTSLRDWDAQFLKPMLSDSAEIDACILLERKEYPGGRIFMCSLQKELWRQPAVLLIGELKVSYPELFFGTTLFPAFKVSNTTNKKGDTPSQESNDKAGNAGTAYQPLDIFRAQVSRYSDGRSVQPKFDGYYRCEKVTPKMKTTTGGHEVKSYTEYFRFHPDSTVISAWIATGPTLPPEAAQIAHPLDKSSSYIHRGRFAISGRLITFDLRSNVGTVSYHGELGTDKPIFHKRSYINGNTGTTRCEFVALDK